MAKNTTGKKKIVVAGILASLAVTGNVAQVDAAGKFAGAAPPKGIAISTTDAGSVASANGDNAIAIGRGRQVNKDEYATRLPHHPKNQ